ncbi:hypothetical protein CUMW_077510 [Citrus unshiu]|nr:hypothetical protein CUMW_077510 [Citrus unshiu]
MDSHPSDKNLTLDSTHLFLSTQSSPPDSLIFAPIPRTLPPSKHIPSTRFLIDAFRYAADFSVSYFLSHFHSDHYTGLSPSWSKGIIFCSEITSRLLSQILNINPKFIYPLPIKIPVLIDGCEVVLVGANHCPGAVQFLFKVPGRNGGFERYVHTGDFRFCKTMLLQPVMNEFAGCDAVFLDTTYCNPKFLFPLQEESVEYVVNVVNRVGGELNEGLQKRVLFLVATYVIGKEKILIEIFKKCGRKVCVDSRKMEVLRVLGYGDSGVFTEDESETDVHEIMVERGYDKVVGFVPTGWTYEVKRNKFAVRSKDAFEIHLVPYSEHSNYDELREYVKFLKPKQVIPTVGMDIEKLDSKHANKMRKYFTGLVDEMASKKEFLMGFHRGTSEIDENVEEGAGSGSNEGLSKEGEVKLKKTKATEDNSSSILLDSSSRLEEFGSKDVTALDDEETEKMVQEIRNCLPTWVTQNQILDLISSSGRNIVDAVSNFYEHETQLYEQEYKLPAIKHSIKSTLSPSKRKKTITNNPKKKGKVPSKMESSGAKQPTITSFFNKLLPNMSQGDVVESKSEECPKDENPLQSNAIKTYGEEIDQFLKIINGNESLKGYAATLLEKTKGNVSMALDLYYDNQEGDHGKTVNRLEFSKSSVQFDNCNKDCSSALEKIVSEELQHITDMSVQRPSKELMDPTLVSLPPEKYDPIEHACWSSGQPAPYIHLARTFDLVEAERGKIKAMSMLGNMFRSLLALSPDDVLPAVYLCTNKIASNHENIELNIGGSLVTSAIEEACGTNRSKIRDMYNRLGDLGDVAQECRQTQALLAPPPPLLIKDVYSMLCKISVQIGSGSTARKKSLIVNLMCSCREKEMKFLVRTLVRNLRIGAMMRTILPALAQAVVMNSSLEFSHEGKMENLKEKLQSLSAAAVEAYNILPSLDLLIPSLMNKGIGFSSSTLSMVPGVPIKPMLAKITNGVPQVLKLFQNKAFTCEYKYDGQRAQIHKLVDGTVRIFSRNGDETTSRFPDLISIINEFCKPAAGTFILDAEVDICVFVFDIMFANGEQLLGYTLRQRRKYLKDLFYDEKMGYFQYAKEMTVEGDDNCLTSDVSLSKINNFLEEALHSSCEGIIVKSLDVKRDYVEGLNDSLDLVTIGAWHGNGRKAGWYSPFLMACYNPETEEYQSVCRVMSGFSDSFYIEMKEFFSGDKILLKKPSYYRTAEVPDMWFSPEVVWEIRGADFTISPVHQAAIGLVHPSRGISIRFPRFIRLVSDRNPDECSTAADIAEMFHSQTRKMDVTAKD